MEKNVTKWWKGTNDTSRLPGKHRQHRFAHHEINAKVSVGSQAMLDIKIIDVCEIDEGICFLLRLNCLFELETPDNQVEEILKRFVSLRPQSTASNFLNKLYYFFFLFCFRFFSSFFAFMNFFPPDIIVMYVNLIRWILFSCALVVRLHSGYDECCDDRMHISKSILDISIQSIHIVKS